MKQGDTLSLPKGWEIKKLGAVAEYFNGLTYSPKDVSDNGTIVLRSSNIQNDELDFSDIVRVNVDIKEKLFLKEGDILMCSRNGSQRLVGKTAPILNLPEPMTFGTFMMIIRSEFSPYLLWFFKTDEFKKQISGGENTMINQVTRYMLDEIKIPLPPLPEQQRIVSILDEAFAAIAKAKANAEQNLLNANELFESYLEDLFSKLFRERDKRTVSELAKVIGGYSFKSTDFKKEGKYQVIRMGNVRPGIIRENESPVFIDELDDKALSKALLLPNDVIITQTGTKKKRDYGFTVIIEKENYLLNQRIASIRFSDKYLPKFFLYFSWSNIFKDQYFANETGTVGQGNVGIGAITEAIVPFIPVNEQKMIIDRIDEIRIETQKLEAVYQKKIDDLEGLKKSILQKAFAGELKTEKAIAV